MPKITSSDHYAILAQPVTQPPSKVDSVKKIKVRQSCASNWRDFGAYISTKYWSGVFSAETCALKYQLFSQELSLAVDTFFPRRIIKMHSQDRPWITKQLKRWIMKRQSSFMKHGKDSIIYKFWRNKVQTGIKLAKKQYYEYKVCDLAKNNLRQWWNQIKVLTGQCTNNDQGWYHQFLSDNIMSTGMLATKINDFFVSISEHFIPLILQDPPPNVIPSKLLVSYNEVLSDLSNLKTSKAPGEDEISNTLLKSFAPEFAPVIQDIYNQSLREAYFPDTLKRSIVILIPKTSPPKEIESALRPIALTSCLAKVLEGFTNR